MGSWTVAGCLRRGWHHSPTRISAISRLIPSRVWELVELVDDKTLPDDQGKFVVYTLALNGNKHVNIDFFRYSFWNLFEKKTKTKKQWGRFLHLSSDGQTSRQRHGISTGIRDVSVVQSKFVPKQKIPSGNVGHSRKSYRLLGGGVSHFWRILGRHTGRFRTLRQTLIGLP